MNQIFFNSPLVVALISIAATVLVSWLIRRDNFTRREAAESARVVELERRVHNLEASSVTRRDFDALEKRLDEIQTDLREIRHAIEATRASA